jgi:hypothetical protein
MVRHVYLGQNFELRKEIGWKLEIIFLYLLYI